jgi:hypothetical protein
LAIWVALNVRFDTYWNAFSHYQLLELNFNASPRHMNTKMFIGIDSWKSEEHDIRTNMEMDSKPKIATTLVLNIVWPIEDVLGPF